jgi:hypothetical protein
MLNELHVFCRERGLVVSVGKTKAMVFGGKQAVRVFDEAGGAHYDNEQIQRVGAFKILGYTITDGTTDSSTRNTSERAHLINRARKAHFAAIGRSAKLGPSVNYATHIGLYRNHVIPVMMYVIETQPDNKILHNSLDDLQIRYIRWLMRTSVATPRLPTIYEAGLRPIAE